MTIKLGLVEVEYLVREILPILDGNVKIEISFQSNLKYNVVVDDTVADKIVDACLRLFAKIGLQDNSEPNTDGLFLEHLADRFNTAT